MPTLNTRDNLANPVIATLDSVKVASLMSQELINLVDILPTVTTHGAGLQMGNAIAHAILNASITGADDRAVRNGVVHITQWSACGDTEVEQLIATYPL